MSRCQIPELMKAPVIWAVGVGLKSTWTFTLEKGTANGG